MIAHAAAVPPMRRYEINEPSGCWLWLGYTDKNGYARLNGQNAHRVFYETHVGPVPEGFDVDHLCKRRNCVNPAHLEAVSEVENLRRQTRTVTFEAKHFEICREGHPMEGDNLRMYAGKRTCAQCTRDKDNARRRAAGIPARNFSLPSASAFTAWVEGVSLSAETAT